MEGRLELLYLFTPDRTFLAPTSKAKLLSQSAFAVLRLASVSVQLDSKLLGVLICTSQSALRLLHTLSRALQSMAIHGEGSVESADVIFSHVVTMPTWHADVA